MKFWNLATAALLAGGLGLTGVGAQAGVTLDVEPPQVSAVAVQGTTNGTAVPGGTAFTSFTIAFTGTYDFISLDMAMSYDPEHLTFNPLLSSVSMSGTPVSLPVFLTQLAQMQAAPGSDFTFYAGQNKPGDLFFGAGYAVEGSRPLTGNIVVTTAFDLAPSFAAGAQSQVHIERMEFTDYQLAFSSLASVETPVTMTVTAVPEPETWLMMLAGLGLMGAFAKRRAARA